MIGFSPVNRKGIFDWEKHVIEQDTKQKRVSNI